MATKHTPLDPEEGNYNSDKASAYSADSYASFQDKLVRQGFIAKVYGILSVQLFVTFGIVAAVVLVPSLSHFVQNNIGAYYAAYVLMIVCLIAISCCGNARRSYPTNYILLGAFVCFFLYYFPRFTFLVYSDVMLELHAWGNFQFLHLHVCVHSSYHDICLGCRSHDVRISGLSSYLCNCLFFNLICRQRLTTRIWAACYFAFCLY
jgi:hypothetical protein